MGNRVRGDFAHADVGARLPTLQRYDASGAAMMSAQNTLYLELGW